MAGDWIKMRTVLQTSPKVVRIASALKADRLRAVGGLHAVWCLFDAHSEDGKLFGYTPEILDQMIGWEGFTKAMESVDWIIIGPEHLELPGFEDHNGQSAKRRAQEADRKRRVRESAKPSAPEADKKRTREEKRREDNTHSSTRVERCPVQQIIDLYNETAKLLPVCRVASDAMRSNISARWKQDEKFKSMEFWRELFEYCERNTFLSGRKPSRDGGEPFRVSLDWIVKPTNFAKIVNLNYDRDSETAAA